MTFARQTAASVGRRTHGIGRRIEAALDGWFLGLFARVTFAAVLFGYYWTSALTKIGDGPFGFLTIADSAYIQIVPQVMEASGYDASAIPFFPWGLLVSIGTYAEFLLPVLLVVGLWTRLAALAMIGFVVVQSAVDILFHNADATTVGRVFDRVPSSAIVDQRMLWIFLLTVLVVKGAGALSIDRILCGARRGDSGGT
jgi:putative oxidoreductase